MAKSISALSYYQATATPHPDHPAAAGRRFSRCLRHRGGLYRPFGSHRAGGAPASRSWFWKRKQWVTVRLAAMAGRSAPGSRRASRRSLRSSERTMRASALRWRRNSKQLLKDRIERHCHRLRPHLGLPPRHPQTLAIRRTEGVEGGMGRSRLHRYPDSRQAPARGKDRHEGLSWGAARRRCRPFSSAELLPRPRARRRLGRRGDP